MTLSVHTLIVRDQLSRQLQSLYNLNWKHLSNRPDGKSYTKDDTRIDFWPTAMDYTVAGDTYQVKWEIIGHRVVNITFPHESQLMELSKFLNQYLWGTE